jgi:hypothetical protein
MGGNGGRPGPTGGRVHEHAPQLDRDRIAGTNSRTITAVAGRFDHHGGRDRSVFTRPTRRAVRFHVYLIRHARRSTGRNGRGARVAHQVPGKPGQPYYGGEGEDGGRDQHGQTGIGSRAHPGFIAARMEGRLGVVRRASSSPGRCWTGRASLESHSHVSWPAITVPDAGRIG